MTYTLKPAPYNGTWIVDETGKVVVWCHTLASAETHLREKLGGK